MKQKKPEATCRVIRFEYNSVTGNVITASEGTAAVPQSQGRDYDQDQARRTSWHAGKVLFLEPGPFPGFPLEQFTEREMYVLCTFQSICNTSVKRVLPSLIQKARTKQSLSL